MKTTVKELPVNPFEKGDVAKVWKELLTRSKPLSRDEALRKMKAASESQKRSK